MRTQQILPFAIFLVFALLGGLIPSPAHAGLVTYDVKVDTSSIGGSYGYLDFQFNPGGSGASLASATITDFSPQGNLNPNDTTNNSSSGDVTGSLTGSPSPLTLTNDTAFNDFFEGFTFGNNIQFDVTLSGPAIGSSGGTIGSSFGFSLYASDTVTPLLTTDSNGTVATIDVNADGSTSAYTFPATAGGSSVANVSAVPEPSSLVLVLTALPASLLGLAGAWRRREQSSGVACL